MPLFGSSSSRTKRLERTASAQLEWDARSLGAAAADGRRKAVDAAIKVTDPIMVKYLKARFALRNKDCPHLMKF